MTELAQQSIGDYLEHLASAAPAPGGGAVVALTAAQAAALLAMAVQVTGVSAWDVAGSALLDELAQARQQCLALADADARAFESVMAAYRIPKTDPDRAAKLQAALQAATQVPLNVMRQLAALYPLATKILVHVKRHIVSDIGVAINLADAALAGCMYTIRINLAAVTDQHFVAATREELTTLVTDTQTSSRDILLGVEERLGA